MRNPGGPVIGVLGGVGGVGASTFAAVLAAIASGVLLDLDSNSGGIDVLLGIESVPGSRWSDVRVDGGSLDATALRVGLPRWGAASVLAADAAPAAPAVAVLVAAAATSSPVVLDLGRGATDVQRAAADSADLVLVVASARLRALAAARATISAVGAPVAGAVLRRGGVRLPDAAGLIGVPLVARLPALPRRSDDRLDPDRPPRPLVRAAAGVLDAFRP